MDRFCYKLSTINYKLFCEAKKYIPGGVNSPVRSFKAVGGSPVFISRAQGSKIFDVKGKSYVDYCLSWGTLILGHNHPQVKNALKQAIDRGTSFGAPTEGETKLAQLICQAIPSIELVRFVNSGTEAVMSAIRLARAFTKRDKIIKFEGSYHGHADYLLAKAGSGLSSLGIPNSLGVPADFTKYTIVLDYNNFLEVERIVKKDFRNIAAIIIEPVCGNMGVVLAKDDFLIDLRKVCDKYGILLIFDEVITGFRISYGGAQRIFKVEPDLTCLGKIIGGGLPIGAYGGRREIMELISPLGGVYQAGTLAGNPLAVAGGIKTLELLKANKIYQELEDKTKILVAGIKKSALKHKIKIRINCLSSMFSIFFTETEVIDYQSAKKQDTKMYARFFHYLLDKGIYFVPSAFESNFLSIAHTANDIKKTLEAIDKIFQNLKES